MINPRKSYSIHPMFTTFWRFPKSWQPQKSSQNVWISWDRRPLPRKRPIHRRCRCLRFPGPNLQMETENLLKRGQNNHKPPMTGNGNHTTYLLWWWLGDGLWHCLPTLLKKGALWNIWNWLQAEKGQFCWNHPAVLGFISSSKAPLRRMERVPWAGHTPSRCWRRRFLLFY